MKSNSSAIDGDRTARGLAIDARQRAVRLVVAHQPIDAIDFVERLLESVRAIFGVPSAP